MHIFRLWTQLSELFWPQKTVILLLSGCDCGDLSGAGKYGNFNISDETGQVYVYGLLSGWRGASGQFQTLVAETGLKAGDLITIVGREL